MALGRIVFSRCSGWRSLPLRLNRLIAMAGLLASLPLRSWGAELFPPPELRVEAGQEVVLPLYLSGASRITVGVFQVTMEAPEATPLPSILQVEPGPALHAAAIGCDPCLALSAYPLRTQMINEQEARVLFTLPSGDPILPGDGISGDSQEIARIRVRIPADAPVGTAYPLRLSGLEFSDAGSEPVTVTARTGSIVVSPPIVLKEGPNTAYHDKGRPGHLLVPTSGDDPSTPEVEAGFPADGRVIGSRSYIFAVEAAGLGDSTLSWSVAALHPDGTPAPESLTGTIESGDVRGTSVIYTPAAASMAMAEALRIRLTARIALATVQTFTIEAVLLPYGDANLDGRVTRADHDLAFRWANGLEIDAGSLPQESIMLRGYQPSAVRRLLTDVRGAPGIALDPETADQWTGEIRRLGGPEPALDAYPRAEYPFGDGRITHADAQWIARKAALNAETPTSTLDPRRHGTPPVSLPHR